ncbi:MAG: hypothetical protein K9J12_10230 [Melioribacteraceae bacterium]|nr:hypothetical protein [Melioribacteraceae bacterium]MCF8265450.1 hypothetical protein [Melioribacteraceae bacterium]MCF8431390.1 hypothetical protein [Melioribacteraceae bacterium]
MGNLKKNAKIYFLLIAIHSLGVGFALIILPSDFLMQFGYHQITEPFFKVQGGVFHIVMAIVYYFVFIDPIRNINLIKVTFIAKFIATLFLISFFVFYDPILVVLLSGLGDFLMGFVAFYFYKKLSPSIHE